MKRLLAIMALAVTLTACSANETLLRDLPERDANEIISILSNASIEANKHQDPKAKTYAVVVRKADLARSVSVLNALGLPKESRPSMNELFKSGGFAPSPFEERVRYIYGITQELERTIAMVDGVLQTRVHVVIPEEKGRRREGPVVSKASVYINYDDRYEMELQVPKIRKLVEQAIENLSADHIEIYTTPTKVNLQKAVSVPISSWMGVRVHKDDSWLLLAWLAVLSVGWGALVYTQLPKIKALLKLK